MRRSGARLTSPIAATRTIAPRIGWGQVGQQGGQQGQGEDGHRGRDQLGDLGPGPGPVVDRRLGGAPAGRVGLEQPPGQVGRPEGEQLPVGVDRRVGPGREGAGGRDGLDERHQRDPGRGRQQAAHAVEVGQGEGGEAAVHRPDQRDPAALQVGRGHQGDPEDHHDQRAGHLRGPAVQGQQGGQPPEGEGDRGRVGVAQLAQRRPHLGEEAVALDRDAQHLAELAGGDVQPHAGLEAGQHRRGDEVGQEPQA
jgi:hypothetical protein